MIYQRSVFPFQVPPTIEICYVPRTKVASQYPCFVLFTQVARMMRPVTNLSLNKLEMIGTFEQASLNICITPKEAIQGVSVNDIHQTKMPACRTSRESVGGRISKNSDCVFVDLYL